MRRIYMKIRASSRFSRRFVVSSSSGSRSSRHRNVSTIIERTKSSHNLSKGGGGCGGGGGGGDTAAAGSRLTRPSNGVATCTTSSVPLSDNVDSIAPAADGARLEDEEGTKRKSGRNKQRGQMRRADAGRLPSNGGGAPSVVGSAPSPPLDTESESPLLGRRQQAPGDSLSGRESRRENLLLQDFSTYGSRHKSGSQ